MTGLIGEGDDPLTRVEVCQFENHLDSRLQAINARFTTMDRRSVSVADRLHGIEQRLSSLPDQQDQQFRSVIERLDAVEARVDHDLDVMQPRRAPREWWRNVVITIGAMTLVLPTATWIIAWMSLR